MGVRYGWCYCWLLAPLVMAGIGECYDRPWFMEGGWMRNDDSKPKHPEPREVEVPDSSYQPNREELQQDLRREGTFEDAIKALVNPVKIRRVMPKRKR